MFTKTVTSYDASKTSNYNFLKLSAINEEKTHCEKGAFDFLRKTKTRIISVGDVMLEQIAKHDFNVTNGPIFGKPVIMYFIKDALESGEHLSYYQLTKLADEKGFPYDFGFPKFKLGLLGGLLVLTEQNFLHRAMENGTWVYSLASIRRSEMDIKLLSSAFYKLKRGQTLKEEVLC